MPNKNTQLIKAYRQFQSTGEACVMATIIETFGSTYQKAGARMVITQTGELLGLLGGGCFERDLFEHARQVFNDGQPRTVFYDMRASADVVWGLGLGCNGAVRILLQLLTADNDYCPLDWIAHLAEEVTDGLLATVCESTHPDFPASSSYLWTPTAGEHQSSPDSAAFPFAVPADQTLSQQTPRLASHLIDQHTITVFYDVLHPTLHLLIIGAGMDAIPLLHCAKALNWRVTLVDYRPAYLVPERFPGADCLLACSPEALPTTLDLNKFSGVILMTHNFENDQSYLKAVYASPIPFIGMLGPKQRHERITANLGIDKKASEQRIFGPVGLDIGAETPEEIAMSIMAGIHAELRGQSGRQLSY